VYTIYASSRDSKEKAVAVNVTALEGKAITAAELNLTPVGSLTGKVTLDGASSGNEGFLVFIAGTSYMAVTDSLGNFTISDVPVGANYTVIIMKGSYTTIWGTQPVNAGNITNLGSRELRSVDISGGENAGLQWKGSLISAPANPQVNWAYYNTAEGKSYIYDGKAWQLLAQDGAQGAKGDQGEKGDKGDTGSQGATGQDGQNGVSIVWQGAFTQAPDNPQLNWAYYNTTAGKAYIYDGTTWQILAQDGAVGQNGVSLEWKGSLSSSPSNPQVNWAYYDTIQGKAFIYDGSAWQILAQDGGGGFNEYFTTIFTLTNNTWADGAITASNNEQWFKFTATADRQYIYVNFGTLTNLDVQLYDSTGSKLGNQTNLSGSSGGTTYTTLTALTSGQTYYLRVTQPSNTGTYRLGVSNSNAAPGTIASAVALSANTWKDGAITASNNEQWFWFTATAATQYIHVSFGTLTDLYVQLYDSPSSTLGSRTILSSTKSVTLTALTSGEVYYIRVTPHWSGDTGTYRIGVNTMGLPPDTLSTAVTLSTNTWKDGAITASNNEQWFKFTATAATQYILVKFSTLTDLYVRLYDNTGSTLGNQTNLSGSNGGTKYTTLTALTSGQTYYLRVTPYGSNSGSYWITFNTVHFTPEILAEAITLSADTWYDGAITSDNGQWFKFTATAATQYIHVSFGTLTQLYVQFYDGTGDTLGSQTNLYGNTKSKSSVVTSGEVYYVRVTPHWSGDTGTYRIGFNASSTAPN
jgi:hypothetical protein